MYNIKLKEGDKIDIHYEPKSDFSDIECQGVLLEKQDYSCTFVMDYEQMFVPKNYSLSFMDASVDRKRIEINNMHEYLKHYLQEPKALSIIEFRRALTLKCSNKITAFNAMYEEIERFKERYKDKPSDILNNVLSIPNKYIIRYIHQNKMMSWRPSLFELQKWKVKLVKDDDPFFIPFVSYRYVRVLKKICPSDKTVANLTSNNVKYSKYV